MSKLSALIPLSQVCFVGNPAAACRYLTSASTLGRSYALSAHSDVLFFLCVVGVVESSVGLSVKRHIFGICVSLHPVRKGSHFAEYTVTSFEVNVTVQPTSQIGPLPTNLFVKVGMICPSQGMSWPCCSMSSVAVADDATTFPLAVPTRIFGAAVFIGLCGACGDIYWCDTPVSAIPVCIFGSEFPT